MMIIKELINKLLKLNPNAEIECIRYEEEEIGHDINKIYLKHIKNNKDDEYENGETLTIN